MNSMTPASRNHSAEFEQAATEAVIALYAASERLQSLSTQAQGPRTKFELNYLYSLAHTTAERGLHLIDTFPDQVDEVEASDLPALLAATQDRLIDHVGARDNFTVLQFVNDIGVLSRAMRHHVQQY